MVVKIETFNGCDEKALKGTAEVAQLTTVYMCTGQGSQEPSMCMDIYSLSPAAYAVWEGMDAHLLVVYGFSIIKTVKVHQCYMDMIYDTMDKDGNINTFPLFNDINICTPKWPSLCHSICPDFSHCDRESWLWGYGFVQKDCAFAGHSLGEYSVLASITDALPIFSLIDVVFYQGITM